MKKIRKYVYKINAFVSIYIGKKIKNETLFNSICVSFKDSSPQSFKDKPFNNTLWKKISYNIQYIIILIINKAQSILNN